MFLEMTMVNNIKTSQLHMRNAKFLDSVKDFLILAKRSLTNNLMKKLTTIKYDGTKGVQQYILYMKN
ncbi:hypothetical protein NC652_001965 [Populus alba x Populus x berolinensis]|nr:hypothetical protein NC652_001965 [Populus alba x Populus x berolinensis]